MEFPTGSLTLVLVILHLSSATVSSTHVTVETTIGKIVGRGIDVHLTYANGTSVERKINTFFGVPFAQSPEGELRFKPPRPQPHSSERRNAFEPTPPCPQPRDTFYKDFSGSQMWNYIHTPYEDCLKLNIWAPANIQNAATMVWIFGGGFTAGSPNLAVYNGEGLAAEGNVIVININYRLGIFGFLYYDHEDIPGNMGLLDQQMALRWIKQNIRHFGGNPNLITIFGESAGAASVVAHMISPASRDLFTYGILQSGSIQNPWAMDTPEYALEKANKLIDYLGCQKGDKLLTIRCLERVPMDKLVQSTWGNEAGTKFWGKYFMEFPFVFVSKDINFFAERGPKDTESQPFDALDYLRAGNFKHSNILVGFMKDEGTFWMNYYIGDLYGKSDEENNGTLDREQYLKQADYILGRERDIYRYGATHLYDPENTCDLGKDLRFMDALNQIVGDNQFTCDMFYVIDRLTEMGGEDAKAYLYYFTHRPSSITWPTWMGAIHGYEIEIVFGIPLVNRTHSSGQYTREELVLTEKVINLWTTFAKTGAPTERTHTWPTSSWKAKPHFLIDLNPRLVTSFGDSKHLKQKECEYWNKVREIEYNVSKYVIQSDSTKIVIHPVFVLCCAILQLCMLQ